MQKDNPSKDLRWIKTERAIKHAFLELCHTKDPYKVTVVELSRLAEINKSTFYAHYETIPDLISALEDEVVIRVVDHLGRMDMLFNNPDAFIDELYQGMAKFGTVLIDPHASERIHKLVRPAIEAEVQRREIGEEGLVAFGSLLVFLVAGVGGVIDAGMGPQSLGYIKQALKSGLSSLGSSLEPATNGVASSSNSELHSERA